MGQRSQTHCKRGHEFTPENTRLDGHGYRSCIACLRGVHAERRRERYLAKYGSRERTYPPIPEDITILAYTAGIFDGEGNIGIAAPSQGKYTRYHRLHLNVANTDPRLTTWLQEHFGGYVFSHDPKTVNRSPWQKWVLNAGPAVTFLEAMRPYLLLKADQADLAITFQKTVGRGRERPLTPEVVGERERIRQEIMALNQLRRLKVSDTPVLHDNREEE